MSKEIDALKDALLVSVVDDEGRALEIARTVAHLLRVAGFGIQPNTQIAPLGDMDAQELSERIAHFPRVRLCQNVQGECQGGDYLLSEANRFLICKALRELGRVTHMDEDRPEKSGSETAMREVKP